MYWTYTNISVLMIMLLLILAIIFNLIKKRKTSLTCIIVALILYCLNNWNTIFALFLSIKDHIK